MRWMGYVMSALIVVGPAVAAESSEQARFLEEQLKITEGYSPASEQWRYATIDKVHEGTTVQVSPATARYEHSMEHQNTAH